MDLSRRTTDEETPNSQFPTPKTPWELEVGGWELTDLIRRRGREIRHAPRRAGELEYVQPRVRPIDDVNVAAVVHFDVIGLNRDLAAFVRASSHTALVGLRIDRRNEVGDLLRVEWIAYIKGAHAGVEPRHEQHAAVIDRRHVLVGRVRPESAAARA